MDVQTVIKSEPETCDDESKKYPRCRLCATISATSLDIYGEQGISNQISEKINLYLPTKVSPFDQLTLSCCWNCYDTIISWHEFVETCVNSERILKHGDSERLTQVEGNRLKVDYFHSGDMCAVKSEVIVEEEIIPNSEFVTEDDYADLRKDGKNDSEFVLKCEVDLENELILDENIYHGSSQATNQSEPMTESTEVSRESTNNTREQYNSQTHICTQAEDTLCEEEEYDVIEIVEGTHFCEQCNISFKSNRGLQIHTAKRHQSDLKPANETNHTTCEHCGTVYNSVINYKAHIYSMHTVDPQPLTQEEKWRDWEIMKSECKMVDEFNKVLYKCPECPKLFNRASFLMNHQTTHTGAQFYSCAQCDKKFSHRQSLASHIKIRHGGKTVECEVCGMKFGKKSFLTDHMLVHKQEKTFICEKCGKGFSQRNGLRIHLRSHADGLPQFECAFCKRGFYKWFEYRRHLDLHKVDRPFQCDKCKAHFHKKKEVEDHMKKHEGPNEFFCQFCGSCFSRKNNLSKHLKMCIYKLP